MEVTRGASLNRLRTSAYTETGGLAVNRNATLGMGYTGEFASRSQQHTLTLNARWAF